MENFSTPRRHRTPAVVNVVTLAVLASATVWSGSQRAEPGSTLALAVQSKADANTQRITVPARNAVQPAAGNVPVLVTTNRDLTPLLALQPVGYQASLR